MRMSSKAVLTLFSLASITLSACSSPESLMGPGTNTDGTGTGGTGTGGTGTGGTGTGGTGTGGTETGGTGGTGTSDTTTNGPTTDTTYTGGSPGGSTSGGATETDQGFLGWELKVLPSGELQFRFRQTDLAVSSFSYVVGGSVTGQWQCYNKADNTPQGQPFSDTISATATLGAQSINGSINAILTTSVMSDKCGNTQFVALPVAGQPWTWSGIYLDNPAGRLPLPSISLGDAPVGFSVP